VAWTAEHARLAPPERQLAIEKLAASFCRLRAAFPQS
jgi:hypothetical protein